MSNKTLAEVRALPVDSKFQSVGLVTELKEKKFHEIAGSDHSFRSLHDVPSLKPLEEVYRHIPQLFGAW